MVPPALFLPLNAIRNLLSAKHGEALIAPLLAIAFLFAMVWDDLETSFSAAIASMQTDANAGSVVLSFTHGGSSAAGDSELVFLVDFDAGLCARNWYTIFADHALLPDRSWLKPQDPPTTR